MQITVSIPDELAAQIEARGVGLEAYLRALIQEKLLQEHASESQRRKAVDAMLQFAEKHGARSGGEGLKKTLHEGHKY